MIAAIGGAGVWPIPSLRPAWVMGESSNLLILLEGIVCFLTLGVRGEPEILAVTFGPLAVFFSTQITLSYCGDDEAGRARFPRIVGQIRGWVEKSSGGWGLLEDHYR